MSTERECKASRDRQRGKPGWRKKSACRLNGSETLWRGSAPLPLKPTYACAGSSVCRTVIGCAGRRASIPRRRRIQWSLNGRRSNDGKVPMFKMTCIGSRIDAGVSEILKKTPDPFSTSTIQTFSGRSTRAGSTRAARYRTEFGWLARIT